MSKKRVKQETLAAYVLLTMSVTIKKWQIMEAFRYSEIKSFYYVTHLRKMDTVNFNPDC